MNESRFDLFDLAIVLLQKKKALFRHFLFISFVAIIISLLLPKYYRAITTFLPPDQGSGSGLSALMENFTIDILGTNEISKRQLLTILNSREIKEKIINKFDLIRVYRLQKRYNGLELAIKTFEKNSTIDMEEEGGLGFSDVVSFTVTILDKDSNRCAEMANYYILVVDEKVKELNGTKAHNNKIFLQGEIEKSYQKLEIARNNLKSFQIENRIFDVPTQVGQALKSLGEFKAQVISLETQKAYLSLEHNSDFQKIRELSAQISIINHKIEELERNRKPDLMPGLDNSLGLANRYADLFLEVEAYTSVIKLLRQQYEQACIQEAKSIPSLKIIDYAKVPQKKYKPKRSIIVIVLVSIYMLGFVLLICAKSNFAVVRKQNPALTARVDEIMRNLRIRVKS